MKTLGKCLGKYLTIGIIAGSLYMLPQYVLAKDYDSREKVETIQLDTIQEETPKPTYKKNIVSKTSNVNGLDTISSAGYSTNSTSQDPISDMIANYKKENGASKPNPAVEKYIKESKKIRGDLKNKKMTPDEVIIKMNALLEKYHKEVYRIKNK